jgi:hypothetical protein
MRSTRDVNDDDMNDVNDVVPPGGVVRVPLYLCDTVQAQFAFDADAHRPHYAALTDEVRKLRAETRAEYLANLRDAWRSPARCAVDNDQPDLASRPREVRRHLRAEPDDNVQARRNAAWAAYKDQLSNAWRTDPRAATAIERQGERWRGGR